MSASSRRLEWRRRRGRSAACFVFLFLCLAAGGNLRANSADESAAEEYAVKAAFLYHFAQFVEWPEGAFQNANSPLVYCTIGEDPFQGALDNSLKGKFVGARAVQVRHLRGIQEGQGCHLIFLGGGDKQVLATLALLRGNAILTVGESERFAKEGGMIGFCLEENKIRFEINLEAAEQANLRISSRLLTLAKTVIGKPKRD